MHRDLPVALALVQAGAALRRARQAVLPDQRHDPADQGRGAREPRGVHRHLGARPSLRRGAARPRHRRRDDRRPHLLPRPAAPPSDCGARPGAGFRRPPPRHGRDRRRARPRLRRHALQQPGAEGLSQADSCAGNSRPASRAAGSPASPPSRNSRPIWRRGRSSSAGASMGCASRSMAALRSRPCRSAAGKSMPMLDDIGLGRDRLYQPGLLPPPLTPTELDLMARYKADVQRRIAAMFDRILPS